MCYYVTPLCWIYHPSPNHAFWTYCEAAQLEYEIADQAKPTLHDSRCRNHDTAYATKPVRNCRACTEAMTAGLLPSDITADFYPVQTSDDPPLEVGMPQPIASEGFWFASVAEGCRWGFDQMSFNWQMALYRFPEEVQRRLFLVAADLLLRADGTADAAPEDVVAPAAEALLRIGVMEAIMERARAMGADVVSSDMAGTIRWRIRDRYRANQAACVEFYRQLGEAAPTEEPDVEELVRVGFFDENFPVTTGQPVELGLSGGAYAHDTSEFAVTVQVDAGDAANVDQHAIAVEHQAAAEEFLDWDDDTLFEMVQTIADDGTVAPPNSPTF